MQKLSCQCCFEGQIRKHLITYCKIEVNKELSKIATTWRVQDGELSHGVLIISVITS